MRVRSTSPLALTFALRDPETAADALEALAGQSDPVAVDGLLDLLEMGTTARPVVTAVELLAELTHPAIDAALVKLLRSQWPSVQSAAIAAIDRRGRLNDTNCREALALILSTGSTWMLRRDALRALAATGDRRWLIAASDPHWRVRHAFALLCLEHERGEVEAVLAELQPLDNLLVQGVIDFLRWRLGDSAAPQPREEPVRPPIWDDDPAVLERLLREAAKESDPGEWTWLPQLVLHDDECVHRRACELLLRSGDARQLAAAAQVLSEPRHAAYPAIVELFARIDRFRCEEVREIILSDPAAGPGATAWAKQTVPGQPSDERVQRHDASPAARAAALTPERAAALFENSELETSWRVLEAACQLLRRPLWEITPDPPWQPPQRAVPESPSFSLTLPAQPAHQRLLGPAKTPVSALALSGHYRLPAEGFSIGVERGINLFFWEPNYDTLTAFSRGVALSQRQQLHFIAGTFAATPQAIRKDAERALRVLRIERLELFLLFWTRSWQRLDDEVRRELEDLRRRGIVHQTALSTHNRTLALEAIDEGWNPVMVRHSAVHRGAEQAIFPAALAKGTSLLAFNSTCYGRLLRPAAGVHISAADCYRFTLSHSAVTACLTAPATLEQLHENLGVLANLPLDPPALERLLQVGTEVYREDSIFRQTLR